MSDHGTGIPDEDGPSDDIDAANEAELVGIEGEGDDGGDEGDDESASEDA